MAKNVPKITYNEGIVLADSNRKFTHIFLSESGFSLQEPPTYVPNSKNFVRFSDLGNRPIASHEIDANGRKNKPSSPQRNHHDAYLFYFKKSTHELKTFPLFMDSSANVVYRDVTIQYSNQPGSVYYHKSQDRNFINLLQATVMNRAKVTEIDEDFLKIFNQAVSIANEKVHPSPPIAAQLF